MPFFTCIYPHSISRRIVGDSSRSNISSGWIGTGIAACPAARTSSGRVRLLVVVCVIVNNVRKRAWIFRYPKKESKKWISNAENILISWKKIIDILYQSKHLLHRFFQFEPTTKTPPSRKYSNLCFRDQRHHTI